MKIKKIVNLFNLLASQDALRKSIILALSLEKYTKFL